MFFNLDVPHRKFLQTTVSNQPVKNANYEEKKDPAYQNTSKTTKKLPASLPLKETVRNKQINGKKKKKQSAN